MSVGHVMTPGPTPARMDDLSDPSVMGAAREQQGEQPSNKVASVSGPPNASSDCVTTVQAYHVNSATTRPHPADRLFRVSSAPSLTHLTRDARYATAEAALRIALSQCDTEPSPLELQVRVMEKGLQAWTARAGRGYERVRKAEETLAAVCRNNRRSGMERGSMSDLQREKWMGIKERDEALEMVEKIKVLIAELSTDIKKGLKAHSQTKLVDPLPHKTPDEGFDSTALNDMPTQKAPILFSGKLPPPYLHNLPRSRHSVEPLRLGPGRPLITSPSRRQRSSTFNSGSVSNPPSSSATEPSASQPSTPTNTSDCFGAALIHTPLPLKSMAQYVTGVDESDASDVVLDRKHTLPSYVSDLLDELSEDRIGATNLDLGSAFEASPSISSSNSPSPPLHRWEILRSSPAVPSTQTPTKRRSKAFFGHTLSSPTSASSSPVSPARYARSKEVDDTSVTPRIPGPDSAAAFEKLLHTFSRASSPTRDGSHLAHQQNAKSPGRIGNIVQNVRKGMKRAVRRGE